MSSQKIKPSREEVFRSLPVPRALSICAVSDPTAEIAMQQLEKLAHCEAHSSVILSHVDENVFKKLEVNITFEPRFQTKKLFHR